MQYFDDLPLDQFRLWKDAGYKFCQISIWVSRDHALDCSGTYTIAEAENTPLCFRGMQMDTKCMFRSNRAGQLFEEQYVLFTTEIARPVGGQLFQLFIPNCYSKDRLSRVELLESRIISQIRMQHGMGAIGPQVASYSIEISTQKKLNHFVDISTFYAGSGSDDDFAERGRKFGLASTDLLPVNRLTADFLDEVFISKKIEFTFIMAWCALEAAVGRGDARRNFCENELQSKIMSDEMLRLHKIRCNLVHPTESKETVETKDLALILEFIRLRLIRHPVKRSEISRSLEDDIRTSKDLTIADRMKEIYISVEPIHFET